ncbi:hypothetical protein [Clostridium sp.]|uniref:hypothetical protein n=1 Tax=Clostridium sp. TaxID=1506 RepID=UPI00260FA33B|nr:hypothetical protein [Clostridium sp.]
MNNYKITFERSNGTIGSDTFTDKNEQEARSSFRACYRNDVYKIISVEIVK